MGFPSAKRLMKFTKAYSKMFKIDEHHMSKCCSGSEGDVVNISSLILSANNVVQNTRTLKSSDAQMSAPFRWTVMSTLDRIFRHCFKVSSKLVVKMSTNGLIFKEAAGFISKKPHPSACFCAIDVDSSCDCCWTLI